MTEHQERDQLAATLDLLIAVIAVEIRAEERDEADKQRTRHILPPRRRLEHSHRNANGTFAAA